MHDRIKAGDREITNVAILAVLKASPAVVAKGVDSVDLAQVIHQATNVKRRLTSSKVDSGLAFFRATLLTCCQYFSDSFLNNSQIYCTDYRGVGGKDEAEVLIRYNYTVRIGIKCLWIHIGGKVHHEYAWQLAFDNKGSISYSYQGLVRDGRRVRSLIRYIGVILDGEGYNLVRDLDPVSLQDHDLQRKKALYHWLRHYKFINAGAFKAVYDNKLHDAINVDVIKSEVDLAEWNNFKALVKKAKVDVAV